MIIIYRFINKLIATGLYTGFIPGAPGTYGSLLALLLILLFPIVLTNPLTGIMIIIIGIITSTYEEKQTGIKDDPRIVIDEICGLTIACSTTSDNIILVLLAFIFFRFFDIVKPFPVNKMQNLPGGWGIMADDILAGLITRLILFLAGGVFYEFL